MKLSVIVCTRNRAHAITECLASIAASLAHAAPVEAEIVVVDNASADNTMAVVEEWTAGCAFPVQLLSEPKKGASRARNRGIMAAKGDLLAFTDDDCRLSKEHISTLLRYDAADTQLVLRGGRVDLGDPSDLPLTIMTCPTHKRRSLKDNSARHEHLGGLIGAGNLAMRREMVARLGLFDVRMGPGSGGIPAGEDTDYMYRAYLAGITIEYVPDMIAFHYHGRKKSEEGNLLLRDYLRGEGGLYAKYLFKHPNLCRMFIWDVKNAFRELMAGKNNFLPEYNFSYKDKVFYSLLGAIRGAFVLLTRKNAY